MSLNTNNKCGACDGRVTNIDGKRYTIEQLTAVHRESCPQRGVDKKTKDPLAEAAADVKDMMG
jgi:hypothetical protein